MSEAQSALPTYSNKKETKTEKDPGLEASNKIILKMAEKAIENKDAKQFQRLIPALQGAGYNEHAIDAMGTHVMNKTPMEEYRQQQENTILGFLTGAYDKDQKEFATKDIARREQLAQPYKEPTYTTDPKLGMVKDLDKDKSAAAAQTQFDNQTTVQQNMEHIAKHSHPDYLPEDNPLVEMFRDNPEYLKQYFAQTIAGMPADKIQPYTVQQEKEWYQELERIQNANPGMPMSDAMNQTIVKTRMFPKSAANLKNVPVDQKLLHSTIVANQALTNEGAYLDFKEQINSAEGMADKKISEDEYKKLFLINVLNDMQQAGMPLDDDFQAIYDAATNRGDVVNEYEREQKALDQAALNAEDYKLFARKERFKQGIRTQDAALKANIPTATMPSAIATKYMGLVEHSNTIQDLNDTVKAIIYDPETGTVDYSKLQTGILQKIGAKLKNYYASIVKKADGKSYTQEDKDGFFASLLTADSKVWETNLLAKKSRQLMLMMYEIAGKQLSDKEFDNLAELFTDVGSEPKYFVQSLISLQDNIKNKTESMHVIARQNYKKVSEYDQYIDKILKADDLATTLNIDRTTGEPLADKLQTQQPEIAPEQPDQMMPAHQQQQTAVPVYSPEKSDSPVKNGKAKITLDQVSQKMGIDPGNITMENTQLRAVDENNKELPVGYYEPTSNGTKVYAGDGFWYLIVNNQGGQ
jgi:hypothetical protein